MNMIRSIFGLSHEEREYYEKYCSSESIARLLNYREDSINSRDLLRGMNSGGMGIPHNQIRGRVRKQLREILRSRRYYDNIYVSP